MSEISRAWLLEASGGMKFAVAEYEMIEYVIAPELTSVPLTPEYCSSIILWNDHMVPVVNFGILTSEESSHMHSVSVLAYQENPQDDLKYIAISLQQPPAKVSISDDQACDIQQIDNDIWRMLSISCFTEQGIAVPILGIKNLASSEFSHELNEFFNQAGQSTDTLAE